MSPFNSYILMLPEIVLTVLGVVLLLIAIFTDAPDHRVNRAVPVIAILGLLLALASVVHVGMQISTLHLSGSGLDVDRGGHLRVDELSLFFKGIGIITTMVVVLMAVEYGRRFSSPGEFYGLIVFTAAAVCLLCSAADLVTIYLSMEFLSITSYAMAGYYRENPRSTEAALKYFLYGAINSALMLYGISLLYGLSATGIAGHPATTNLSEVIRGITSQPMTPLTLAAVIFTLGGFFFKVSAVPFHQWAPDTYQGAPTPFTAFLSVASKVGGLAILVRVVASIFLVPNAEYGGASLSGMTGLTVAIVAALSMFVGNLLAVQQRDIKRMLAYSGIAQIGYVLVGVAAMRNGNSDNALQAIIIYMGTYVFMNLGAFGVVTAINNRLHTSDLDDYAGLSQRQPWLAAAMCVFLFSLAGVPPAAGWFGKYYIFFAAIDPRLHGTLMWLAMVLVVNSVIAAYYYLNVAKKMYFEAPVSDSNVPVEGTLRYGIIIAVLVTLFIGILPAPLYNLVRYNATFRADEPTMAAPTQLSQR